ncbi:site-specific DNA-methyltransferase [Calothrix sp. UHCC 0171]|uniref:site-specific DNA-methyltransferase n=1 Tax=Calothrix sp. UHCC 0171 TaxID=3110245 RepID=UPI002B20C50F|nr:site-specific DNA-methyltransferase [Calothrix sp. UHCC 0171]MEA5572277.1 site-specific DNA-methyltransferase [Calothrix sp. UHCC 0171]
MKKDSSLIVTDSEIYSNSSAKRDALYKKFHSRIIHNLDLDRTIVSFQANKKTQFSSWFKYREGFSDSLVKYLIQNLKPQSGVLLDPFSGVGSSLFSASDLGWQTIGIELLPVGIFATRARMMADKNYVEKLNAFAYNLKSLKFSDYYDPTYDFKHLAITRGAFPQEQEKQLVGYISYCHRHIVDDNLRELLLYAAFCILEEISYTRKDGQYLRWDSRSGRSRSKKQFNKGEILTFKDAINKKLNQIIADLSNPDVIQLELFNNNYEPAKNTISNIHLHQGSCLEVLPIVKENSIDFVITSPPYANRYDYTRTYALELAFLGCKEEEVKFLRQAMLSCTVENWDKRDLLKKHYLDIERYEDFLKIDSIFNQQEALNEVLKILEKYKQEDKLNNVNIVRMMHNYFYEMCFVIYELARILKVGGIIAMVNDNVQYAGEEVPVDLILSNIAEAFGLTTRHIWTLGRGKGNSSQQMGHHGRSELRKCIYVWEKKVL